LERAEALRFIIHFVGDLHQPLHTTARDTDAFPAGDRGGNDFKILPPLVLSREARPPQNLHALWDRGVGLFGEASRPLDMNSRMLIDTQAETLMAALPRESLPAAGDDKPMDWVMEGAAIAKSEVYRLKENQPPSNEYMRASRIIVARRAVLAGYRLADLLNKLLG
jgi:hypothetical protein